MSFKIVLYILLLFTSCDNKNQEKNNLESFIKLYGYTRYFYPYSTFTSYTWSKFAYYGINKVKYCKSDSELIDSLNSIFNPIVPELIIKNMPIQNSRTRKLQNNDTIMFWQHKGVKPDMDQKYLPYHSRIVTYSNNHYIGDSLFNTHFDSIQYYNTEVSENIYVEFPVVLTTKNYHQDRTKKLKNKINKYKTDTVSSENKCLADICVFWNIIQHFYPYHQEAKMDWNKALKSIISDILESKNKHENKNYFLFKLAKQTKDRHFLILAGGSYNRFSLPIQTNIINDTAIVEKSYDTTVFKTGDIIKSINKQNIRQLCEINSVFWSGSEHSVNYMTARNFHTTNKSENCNIIVLRNNKIINIKASTSINHYKSLESKEITKKIYYANLLNIDNTDSLIYLAQLYNALIIDWRYGRSRKIDVHQFLKHIIKDSLPSSFNFQTPQIILPNNSQNVTNFNKLSEPNSAYVSFPKTPNLNCKLVILSCNQAISYTETIIKMAKINKLATIIGEKTGGCNGNINITQLPSYTTIQWTGMKTTNWDGSQHHLIGIEPDIEVKPTIAGIKAGKDEVLEYAIEYLKKELEK